MKTPALHKNYGDTPALDFPAWEWERGVITAVIGANGSGKSTLARLLAGVLRNDTREVPTEAGIRVGYMPQRSYAFRMSTIKNVLLGGIDRKRAAELMRGLGIDHLADRRAVQLSGGETARMALARLLMGEYDLLVLDEPTASMDVEATLLTEALLRREVRERDCAVILVTHSIQQAKRLSDRVICLHRGTLLEAGETAAVLSHPQRIETARFLEFSGLNG